MAKTFQQLPQGQRAYFPANQEVVSLLEGITPVEKALAVPYIKIWQVKPGTGAPVYPDDTGKNPRSPLSMRMVEPPRFGSPADLKFRERPPVSLERISIKTNAYRGAFTNQVLEFTWTVHRPDVVFGDEDPTRDNWSSMIIPGMMHVLEYGWQSSGKHPLLNGDGYQSDVGGNRISIPAKRRVSFKVVDYSFKITPDMQFQIVTQAWECGDSHLRTATLAGLKHPEEEATEQNRQKNNQGPTSQPVNVNDKDAKAIFGRLQGMLNQIKPARTIAGIGPVIRFQDFADKFFAPVIEEALLQMGYKKINLWVGRFNQRCGKTVKKFGDKDIHNQSIGEFEVPLDWIHERFANAIKAGENITITNFVTLFTSLFQSQEIWDRHSPQKDKFGIENYTIPDVRVRTITNGDTIDFFITDIKDEVTRFTESDRIKGDEQLTIDQIRKKLNDKNVPYIQLLKANSFILGSDFHVTNDEQLKAILIKRYNAPTREELVHQPDADRKSGAPSPSQLIYASAIVGDLLMIGNFCFDTFAMIWLDFGVKNWNGTFWINEHEDVIERGSFVTRVSIQATGEDPLNTQGRLG